MNYELSINNMLDLEVVYYLLRLMRMSICVLWLGALIACAENDSDEDNNGLIDFVEDFANRSSIESIISYSLVVDDGYQDKTYDVDSVVLGKVDTNFMGEALLWAYSIKIPSGVSQAKIAVLYLDTDNNPLTGKSIGSIGADYVFMDTWLPSDIAEYAWDFYYWTGNSFEPDNIYISGGRISSSIGGIETRTAIAISSNIIRQLYGTNNVVGVFGIGNLTGGDPNSDLLLLDSHQFNYNIP